VRDAFDATHIAAATAAAALCLSVAAWKLREPVATAASTVAAVGVVSTFAAYRFRRCAGWAAHVLPCAAFALAAVFVCARFVPDRSFSVWQELPREGMIHAEGILVRRLRIAALDAPGADPARLVVWNAGTAPALASEDRLLVRLGSPAQTRAASLPTLTRLTPRLDEAVMYGPTPR
jgi:hypothetical protein